MLFLNIPPPRTVKNRKSHPLYKLLVQHSVAMKQFITVFIHISHYVAENCVREKCYVNTNNDSV